MRALKKSYIPERFIGQTLDDYADQPGVDITPVREYIEALKRGETPQRGLLLVGPPGMGKTKLACVVLQEALAQGHTVAFVRFDSYIRMKQDLMTLQTRWEKFNDEDAYADWQAVNDRVNYIHRAWMVAVDDVGKEYGTNSGYTSHQLDWLLRMRYDQGRPTIPTSNIPVGEWGVSYGDAMQSFLMEAYEAIGFAGADYRARL